MEASCGDEQRTPSYGRGSSGVSVTATRVLDRPDLPKVAGRWGAARAVASSTTRPRGPHRARMASLARRRAAPLRGRDTGSGLLATERRRRVRRGGAGLARRAGGFSPPPELLPPGAAPAPREPPPPSWAPAPPPAPRPNP